MQHLNLVYIIIARDRLPAVLKLCQDDHLAVNLIALGRGTAANETLNLLGIEDTEKAVCCAFASFDSWRRLKKDLQGKLRIDLPGIGIAFTVPVSSFGGRRELAFVTQGQNFVQTKEQEMQGTERELLIVICNQGHNEDVMNAARAAGAGGGTVIHARGTGMQSAEQFFGVSLASEKEIIYIVATKHQKNGIMEAIMKQAGIDTPAKAIVFSVPVTDTAGLRLVDADAREKEEDEREEQGA